MSDTVQLGEDYTAARYETCTATIEAVRSLSNSLDFLTEQVGNQPQGLSKFLDEYEIWFGSRFDDIGRAEDHSLAAQQHFEGLYNRLVEIFERSVPEIEKAAKANLNKDSYLSEEQILRDVRSDREEIVSNRKKIAEFKKAFASEIAADMASAEYQRECKAVDAAVEGLQCATRGEWTPEFVKVSGRFGNTTATEVEMPGSAAMSEIARMARVGGLPLALLLSPRP